MKAPTGGFEELYNLRYAAEGAPGVVHAVTALRLENGDADN
jgi:hypothetical protein